MGVSGSGKSTVGALLAGWLQVAYADADDLHPSENVAKMAAGTPLDDADRGPWLDTVARWLDDHAPVGGVVTCSALKRRYRDRLRRSGSAPRFLHLHGPEELIAARLAGRSGHFMPAALLRSQFAALEPLAEDEPGTVLPITGTPEEILDLARAALPLPRPGRGG
ncbi:gluconokinase [Streptomyces sp. AJS327]|uniref:gluconokinase n=1 Tax=Streptomyces sp. AJS327 TaxID=2545265 RepID=UPI0015DFB624|nr:gluconokinase [Streptomyces sp. AJS327]